MTDKNIRFLTGTALMTAALCVLGPMSLPIGPVPISLTNLTIYFFLYILGTKQSAAAYLVYLLVGMAGLPVFSGYSGGLQKLAGPTGGYLIGFIPMILMAGPVVERMWQNRVVCIAAMELSVWVAYLFGTAWLAVSLQRTFGEALAMGVIPFILVDFLKIAAAAVVGPELKFRLQRAGVV
jgi:biotin transport system substrate-specific component